MQHSFIQLSTGAIFYYKPVMIQYDEDGWSIPIDGWLNYGDNKSVSYISVEKFKFHIKDLVCMWDEY